MSDKKSSPEAPPPREEAAGSGAADLDPLLQYLGDVGYGDLYLRPLDPAAARPSVNDGSEASPRRESPSKPAPTAAEPPAAAPAVAVRETEGAADSTERLRILGQEASTCTRCALAEGRTHVVFGTGDPRARLMFIGEGPGYHEDQQGEPFVGAAGQLLNRIIQAIELRREQVYIANIVKCRPPLNRDPLPDEVAACIGYLEQQIRLIQPAVIVALGRVAAQTLLGTDLSLGRMRGQWFDYLGCQLRVTYHPAALLRNESLKRPTWEDMQVVQARLRES
jgi:DNA polymerase